MSCNRKIIRVWLHGQYEKKKAFHMMTMNKRTKSETSFILQTQRGYKQKIIVESTFFLTSQMMRKKLPIVLYFQTVFLKPYRICFIGKHLIHLATVPLSSCNVVSLLNLSIEFERPRKQSRGHYHSMKMLWQNILFETCYLSNGLSDCLPEHTVPWLQYRATLSLQAAVVTSLQTKSGKFLYSKVCHMPTW